MKNYIMLIVTASLGISMLKGMFPTLYEKFSVSFAIKLLVIVIALSPLIKNSQDFLSFEHSFVINEKNEHNIDNEDAEMIWKKALAESTAQTLCRDIEDSLLNDLGIKATVVAPWSVSGNNIIFEKIKIYPECSEEKFKKIEDFIRIHYELDSECEKDDYAQNKE